MLRISAVFKKRSQREKEPTKFKMRSLPHTRRMSKSTGTGRNLRRKKIAKSWTRTSRNRLWSATKSLPTKKSWRTSSRKLSRPRTSTTSSRCNSWTTISMTWSGPWKLSSSTCALTTRTSLRPSSLSLKESVPSCWSKMKPKLSNFLRNTNRPRRSFWRWRLSRRKPNLLTLKTRSHRMRTIRPNKKLSLRKKCKFWKSAWRTWKPFTDWMKKS